MCKEVVLSVVTMSRGERYATRPADFGKTQHPSTPTPPTDYTRLHGGNSFVDCPTYILVLVVFSASYYYRDDGTTRLGGLELRDVIAVVGGTELVSLRNSRQGNE